MVIEAFGATTVGEKILFVQALSAAFAMGVLPLA